MSKEGTSKLVAGGRRALASFVLKRRSNRVPVGGVLIGLALVGGAMFTVIPIVRRALARLAVGGGDASEGGGNRTAARGHDEATAQYVQSGSIGMAAEAAQRAADRSEADELGRAENEGLPPVPS
jgi:hypothetical protein